jgi:hypothetical protein
MMKKSTLLSGILFGMTSSASVYSSTSYPPLRGSDLERLRGDVARVGSDFNKVISTEQKEKTS